MRPLSSNFPSSAADIVEELELLQFLSSLLAFLGCFSIVAPPDQALRLFQ